MAGMSPVEPPALVEEAMKKAAIVWVSAAGHEKSAVWCLWHEGALFVVSGPGEQPAPDLAGAAIAVVTARGDHGGRIVSWPAAVSTVEPDGPVWSAVVPQLAAKRLNAPGTAEQLAARWAAECVVSRLVPAGDPVEAGSTLPDGALAVPPVPTPAVRLPRRPFRLHRVRRPPA
jgi:hypothetical protein